MGMRWFVFPPPPPYAGDPMLQQVQQSFPGDPDGGPLRGDGPPDGGSHIMVVHLGKDSLMVEVIEEILMMVLTGPGSGPPGGRHGPHHGYNGPSCSSCSDPPGSHSASGTQGSLGLPGPPGSGGPT